MGIKDVKRSVLGTMIALLSLIVIGTGQASAKMPWWHVNTVSAPAAHAGIENSIELEVSDLGDAIVDGLNHPVTIVDKLPPGVTPTAVHAEGGGAAFGQFTAVYLFNCTFTASTRSVSCTYSGPLFPYERFMIAIPVDVAPGSGDGTSEISVTGGGAPPLTARSTLTLGSLAPGYGMENYELTPEEEGGGLDTQAGSHPFQLTTTLTFDSETTRSDRKEKITLEIEPLAATKDLYFNLPPGLVGNPTPLPKCSMYVFTLRSKEVRRVRIIR